MNYYQEVINITNKVIKSEKNLKEEQKKLLQAYKKNILVRTKVLIRKRVSRIHKIKKRNQKINQFKIRTLSKSSTKHLNNIQTIDEIRTFREIYKQNENIENAEKEDQILVNLQRNAMIQFRNNIMIKREDAIAKNNPEILKELKKMMIILNELVYTNYIRSLDKINRSLKLEEKIFELSVTIWEQIKNQIEIPNLVRT